MLRQWHHTKKMLRASESASRSFVAICTASGTTKSNVVSKGESKRQSLVLGNLKTNDYDFQSRFAQGIAAGKLSELLGEETMPKLDWNLHHLPRKGSGLH